MTEEQTKTSAKTPEEMKAIEQKRELRGIRQKVKSLREQAKAIQAERGEVTVRYNELLAEMGLPPLKSKSKAASTSE